MKNFYFLLVILCSFGISNAQSLIEGSWEIIEIENNSTERILYGRSDFTGHKIHFLDENNLVLESNYGDYVTPYQQTNEIISYETTELGIVSKTDTVIQLTFNDIQTNRQLKLYLQPSKSLSTKKQSAINKELTTKSLKAFRLDGYYALLNEETGIYSYYRFLTNGSFYNFMSRDTPLDLRSNLVTYRNLSKKTLEFNKINKLDQAVDGLFIDSRYTRISGTKTQMEREHSFQITESGNQMTLYKWQHYDSNDSTSHTSTNFTFHPSSSLAYWLPLDSEEKNSPLLDILVAAPIPKKPSSDLYKVVQQMPRFPGCENELNSKEKKSCADTELLKYIYSNILYPKEAREQGIQGTAVITFVVQADGTIASPRIVRNIGGGCGEEALRVVNKMISDNTFWIPGIQNGFPVDVQFNLPIKFRVERSSSNNRKKTSRSKGRTRQ